MVRFVLIVKVHRCGGVEQCSQQVLLHVPHRRCVLCKTGQYEADMVGIQLFQPTAHHFSGLIISGNPQHLAFGRAGMVLLSIAFVLNLAIVIGLIGGYGSPRRALYTITDELMNSAYRFKRGWQFKNSLP